MSANRIAPEGMRHFAASHPGLFYWHMSHKKDARLKWINSCLKICCFTYAIQARVSSRRVSSCIKTAYLESHISPKIAQSHIIP